MAEFKITGGKPLYGSVRVGGAKNASYKLMIASLLANSPSRLLNFSHISDVALVAQIINSLGAKAEEVGERAYMVDPRQLSTFEIPSEYGQASRASVLFIPALVARLGKAIVPFPGGDKIGARPLERLFEGFKALGATVEVSDTAITVTAEKLTGATYRFAKSSHTGTEAMITVAATANGTTVLENAAEETEIDDLIAFMNAMGARIQRKPGRVIVIEGVKELHGAIHKIMPDQNQVVSFACAALATKGDVIVEDAIAKDLTAFTDKLDEIGAGYEVGSYGMRFYYKEGMKGCYVETQVHPGFKTDWQPLWVTLTTQLNGESVLHETVYESRFAYVESLQKMGAHIELFSPQVENPDQVYNFNIENYKPTNAYAARIIGPTPLKGGEFDVKDLRHGATLIIAGLIAQGQTILHDPENQVSRGYEALAERLRAMGAIIETS